MKIYRGENIIKGNDEKVRLIKTHVPRDGFPCDFLNGGNPYRIAELGIFDATVLHVIYSSYAAVGRCSKKHFASFSEQQDIAEDFAVTDWNGGNPIRNEYEIEDEYYAEDIDQERKILDYTLHMIVELDTAGKIPLSPGCEYAFTLTYNNGNSKLFLLDVVKYLEFEKERRRGPVSAELAVDLEPVLQSIEDALVLASNDKEWLVLSLDIVQNTPNSPQTFSAILKNGNPFDYKYYVHPDWFAE